MPRVERLPPSRPWPDPIVQDYATREVPYLDPLLAREQLQLEDILVLVDGVLDPDFFQAERRYLEFRAPNGWPRLPLHAPSPEPASYSQVSA